MKMLCAAGDNLFTKIVAKFNLITKVRLSANTFF